MHRPRIASLYFASDIVIMENYYVDGVQCGKSLEHMVAQLSNYEVSGQRDNPR
jgi:hypothetical protein